METKTKELEEALILGKKFLAYVPDAEQQKDNYINFGLTVEPWKITRVKPNQSGHWRFIMENSEEKIELDGVPKTTTVGNFVGARVSSEDNLYFAHIKPTPENAPPNTDGKKVLASIRFYEESIFHALYHIVEM